MTPTTDALQPIAASGRLQVLDVLRGFAIFGILQANILFFSGLFLLSLVGADRPSPLDERVGFAIETLVHGKFYSLFSLLFGIGFHTFLSRAEAKGIAARPLFRRRLWLLMAAGFLHATLLWSGDILLLYALIGFALIPFHGVSSRRLLAWAAGLLLLPAVCYALMWAAGIGDPLAPPPLEPGSAPGGGFDPIGLMLTGFAGGFTDAWLANLVQLGGRWVDLVMTLRPPKVLGMFVLGLWIGGQGLARDSGAHAGLLRRVAAWGLGLGLPLNLAFAWLAGDAAPYLPGSAMGMVQVLVEAAGFPLLSLGYAAGIALLLRSRAGGPLQVFAPVGRMALTNYLLQSLICTLLFYGFGFGLFGQVGIAEAAGIAWLVFLAQVPLSAWWLARFQYGPAEWLWRRLTYRTPLAMRRGGAAVLRPA